MVDYSTAAIVAPISIAVASIAITVIKTRGLSQSAIQPSDRHETTMLCPEHTGLVATIKAIQEGQQRIEERMDQNFKEVFDRLPDKVKR
jgi:hypothetical protein